MLGAKLFGDTLLSFKAKTALLLLILSFFTFSPLLFNLHLPAISHQAYIPIHTLFEVFAVVIAAMIFAIIHQQANIKMTWRGVVIACAFFAIFWLDLAHLLSFPGMPDYFTANTTQKTISFWLAARFIAALALCFAVLPIADNNTGFRQYYLILFTAIVSVLVCHLWFIVYPELVPVFYTPSDGLTTAKIAVEYAVMLIGVITVFFLLYFRQAERPFHAPALLAAVISMIFSEFYFTLYSEFSDSYNIIGHILKLLSMLFLYRALVHETLAEPYARLQQSESDLAGTLAAVPDILFDVDLTGRFHHVYYQPESKLYLAPEHFIGLQAQQVLPEHVTRATMTAIAQANSRKGCSDAHQYALTIGEDTEPSWFQVIAALKPGTKESVARFVLAVRDITEQKKAQATEQINALAFHTREAIMITDSEKRIIRVNPAFTDITGYQESEVVGKTPTVFSSGLHDASFYNHLWQMLHKNDVWSGEIYNRRKNGEVYPEQIIINTLKDSNGAVSHYIGSFNDISKAKEDQQRIHKLAFYDPLTHLPNRRLLLEKISDAQTECRRNNEYAALLFIDLDHFKRLNDSFGHSYGDDLLCQLAERLQFSIRASDILARPGGDEFILLAKLQTNQQNNAASDAEIIGSKLLEEIRQPFVLKGLNYNITASIGIALFNDNSKEIDELMSSADLAMYHSKESGRNQLYFFEPQMQQDLRQRQLLEQELKVALDQQQFALYYQPKVNTSGELSGYEALIRWQHPDRGLVSPDVFIPLAESSGLIIEIGNWVLQTACNQIKQNCIQNRPVPIAVNVSQRQLVQKDFVANVESIIIQVGIPGHLLELELTESMLHDDLEMTKNKLISLSQLGVIFSLDDFGTGYSSLTYLKNLPINILKIDQSFVREFLTQDTDFAIVRTIIAMAEALNLTVIAEGVEQQAQYEALLAMGCNLFQGYLFGKPAPMLTCSEITDTKPEL
ncbi:EAL domain-containing protein [Arsukibacterium sp.]|uniref:EAL domain-containing protein n=1 Tax=Arsukibacterium sp. TaxID=1977258 RepID=UPI003565DB6F